MSVASRTLRHAADHTIFALSSLSLRRCDVESYALDPQCIIVCSSVPQTHTHTHTHTVCSHWISCCCYSCQPLDHSLYSLTPLRILILFLILILRVPHAFGSSTDAITLYNYTIHTCRYIIHRSRRSCASIGIRVRVLECSTSVFNSNEDHIIFLLESIRSDQSTAPFHLGSYRIGSNSDPLFAASFTFSFNVQLLFDILD